VIVGKGATLLFSGWSGVNSQMRWFFGRAEFRTTALEHAGGLPNWE
jgi:hypothetical protein